MTLVLCWLVLPLVIGLVVGGCGLLVEQAAGFRLPGALLVPLGLALAIVAANLATMTSGTARLATPLVLALAVAGYGLALPWRRRNVDGWAAGGAIAVYAVYAAPVLASGKATFAGYSTLDDTSTWLTLTDRAMEHGRTLTGLAPSTYQQVLTDYFSSGYPLGAFMPLGVGGKLTGQDIAWLFQPTIALYGAMLALAIYSVSGRFLSSRPLRAAVAFVSAQPALLFAYSLWSGIKEVAAAALIALVCAAVAWTAERWASPRATVPAAVAVAGLFAVLSPAGGIWLVVPALAVVAVLIGLRLGLQPSFRAAATLLVLVAALSIPSIAIARSFVKGASGGEITTSTEVANLGHPLDGLQAFGIWPATDFRDRPHDWAVTCALIAVLLLGAALSLLIAARSRKWAMPFYLATGGGGILLIYALDHVGLSSPWLNAKGMAEGSPALVAAGMAGAAALFETGRRTEAAVIGAVIAAGVLWSNGLAYSNVWLAPRGQLAELQTIGNRFAGQGPTLMTDTEPYGVRHFLRRMDPEGASERRRRLIPLLNGEGLAKGTYADLDEFRLDGILVYKTLVLPRSPVESRPSSIYQLVRSGRYYDVWQRPDTYATILEHLPLGDSLQPGAVPSCSQVQRLAARAGESGRLVAAPRRPVSTVSLSSAGYPENWYADPNGSLYPSSPGDVEAALRVSRPGTYRLWLGGSFRDRVRLSVDGRLIGEEHYYVDDGSHYTSFGSAFLEPGTHAVRLRVSGPDLRPGSGGHALGMGPLVSSLDAEEPAVESVTPDQAGRLCGRRLDWVEAIGS
jgi:hypothetical protein